jgi:hypothetical protein
MPQVAAVNTPSTPDEVAGALVYGYQQVVGVSPPSQSSFLLPLAQAAVETAHFGGGFWNWNCGNITTLNDAIDWILLPNTGGLHFRSYPSLGDGAVSMMSWLKSHGVLPYADAGDLAGYVAQLQRTCYVGCDPAVYPGYQTGMAGYVSKYNGIVPAGYTPGLRLPKGALAAVAILATFGIAAWWVGIEGHPAARARYRRRSRA